MDKSALFCSLPSFYLLSTSKHLWITTASANGQLKEVELVTCFGRFAKTSAGIASSLPHTQPQPSLQHLHHSQVDHRSTALSQLPSELINPLQ